MVYKCISIPYKSTLKIISNKVFITINFIENLSFFYEAFNGEVKYVWIDTVRFDGHKRTVFNTDLSKDGFSSNGYKDIDENFIFSSNYEEMIKLANYLAKDFTFIRVDFYNVDGKIYFGELTFNSEADIEKIEPESFDLELGNQLKI